MKKLITMLAAGTLALCSVVFANSVHPNDVINTVPGSSNRTVLADSSTETHSTSVTTMTSVPSKTTTTTKTTVHHHKKHHAKPHCHKYKHHYHHHYHKHPHHKKVVTTTPSH